MKKIWVVMIGLLLGLGLFWYLRSGKADTSASVPLSNTPGNTSGAAQPTSGAAYKDGSYTGDAVDVGYGTVQIKVTVAGGKLTDIAFLQLPNDRQHSVEVSNYSSPILRNEALQAQSANVDIVSGATSTSEGFQQSLDSALVQAKS